MKVVLKHFQASGSWDHNHLRGSSQFGQKKQIRKITAFNKIFERYDSSSLVNYSPLGNNLGAFLALINILSIKKETVSILDFGGGTGLLYHAMVANATCPNKIRWQVVDNQSLSSIGLEHIKSPFKKISYERDY